MLEPTPLCTNCMERTKTRTDGERHFCAVCGEVKR